MTLPVRAPRIVAAALLCASLTASSAALAAVAQEPSPEPSGVPSPGPSGSPAPPASAAIPAEPVGAWRVEAVDPWGEGLVELPEGSDLTVVFLADSRLEGDTACGRYIGGYALEGEALSLGVVSQGYDACDQRQREEAVGLSTALGTVSSWTATPSGLELLDEAGATRLVLVASDDVSPAGEWVVLRFLRPNGEVFEAAAESPPITMVLEPDGGITGSTGCRLLEGAWTSDGDSIAIGPLEPVGLPCEGSLLRQERQLLRALGGATLWQQDDDELVLLDAFGSPTVEFRAAFDGDGL